MSLTSQKQWSGPGFGKNLSKIQGAKGTGSRIRIRTTAAPYEKSIRSVSTSNNPGLTDILCF